MDFTSQIVIFLAFVGVTVVFNTLLIWFAYKGFATVSMKVTKSLSEIETSSATRQWLKSLQTASEQAVKITEVTKEKMAEFEPALENFHARYGFMLAKIDTRTERISNDISVNATRVRDAVTGPAEKFAVVASGVQSALGFLAPPNGREPQD
jgi:hypothetical protein